MGPSKDGTHLELPSRLSSPSSPCLPNCSCASVFPDLNWALTELPKEATGCFQLHLLRNKWEPLDHLRTFNGALSAGRTLARINRPEIARLLAQQLTQQQLCDHLAKILTVSLQVSCPQNDLFFFSPSEQFCHPNNPSHCSSHKQETH